MYGDEDLTHLLPPDGPEAPAERDARRRRLFAALAASADPLRRFHAEVYTYVVAWGRDDLTRDQRLLVVNAVASMRAELADAAAGSLADPDFRGEVAAILETLAADCDRYLDWLGGRG